MKLKTCWDTRNNYFTKAVSAICLNKLKLGCTPVIYYVYNYGYGYLNYLHFAGRVRKALKLALLKIRNSAVECKSESDDQCGRNIILDLGYCMHPTPTTIQLMVFVLKLASPKCSKCENSQLLEMQGMPCRSTMNHLNEVENYIHFEIPLR